MKYWLHRVLRCIFRRFGLDVRRISERCGSDHAFDHTFDRLARLRDLGFSPASICDVGASDGNWTFRCLEIYPHARYLCVDPLEENHSSLARLKAKFPNVDYWQGCLGPKSGPVILNVDGDGSSILPGHFGNQYGIQREVRIEMLDDLVARGICPQPELIKLDVQGYELEVLKGASKTLQRASALIAEVSFLQFQTGMPIFHEVVRHMSKYGFVVCDIFSLSLRPLDNMVGQADLLFLKETVPLRVNNRWDHSSVY